MNPDVSETLSVDIVRFLQGTGKTLREIGELAGGLDESYVSRIGAGKRTFRMKHLAKLEQALGTSLPLLLLQTSLAKTSVPDDEKKLFEEAVQLLSDAAPSRAEFANRLGDEENIQLEYFGHALRDARLQASKNDPELKHIEGAARKLGLSPETVTRCENGKIISPSKSLLRRFADLYKKDPLELVLRLMRDKYGHGDDWQKDPVSNHRWALFDEALKSRADNPKALEEARFRTLAQIVNWQLNILDTRGLAAWIKSVNPLKEVWVVVPQFIDHTEEHVFEATIFNLDRGAIYTYFVSEEDSLKDGRFDQLRKALLKSKIKKTIKEKIKQGNGSKGPIKCFALGEEERRWQHTDYVLSNPKGPQPAGYRPLRFGDNNQRVGIEMQSGEVEQLVEKISSWIKEENPQIITLPASRKTA